jgi:Pretoxin HINT domain
VAWQVVQKNNADQADLVKALITGDNATLNRLGAQYQKAGEVVAELLGQLSDYLDNLDDYTRGRVVGRIVGEAVVLILTEGAGEIAQLSKATLLEELLPRLRNIEWLQPYIGRVIAEGSDIEKLAEGLKTTKMCFVAGTLVHTAAGLKSIEQIRRGDLVLSRDEKTGEQSYKPVLETFVTRPTRLYHVGLTTEKGAETTLTCTGPHPFYVKGRGFVAAQELAPGDELVLAEGAAARVVCITPEDALEGKPFTTYNFEVADFHTYFVGQAGVWVHNAASGMCEKLFSLLEHVRTSEKLDYWPAFKRVMEETKDISAAVDEALPDFADGVFENIYKAANGDPTKVPTAKEVYEAMGAVWNPNVGRNGAWVGGRHALANMQAHHTAVIQWTEALLKRRLTQAEIDAMPAMLLRTVDHVGAKGTGAFHAILRESLTDGKTYADGTILSSLQEAYSKWDPETGPKVWAVARQWLRNMGVK